MGKGSRAREARRNQTERITAEPNNSTRWNGLPCDARHVTVIVGDSGFFSEYWAKSLVGQQRKAVEVSFDNKTMYLDNEDGSGWWKVTHGGGPGLPSRTLEVQRVIY